MTSEEGAINDSPPLQVVPGGFLFHHFDSSECGDHFMVLVTQQSLKIYY